MIPEAGSTGRIHDVLIVGGGPAGVAAAVYAGAEGLNALVVEDIARNLLDIKSIATENEANALRTQDASKQLHETAGGLNQAMRQLMA